ncbi:MAG: hypothetical protein HFF11_01050 [Angelakisella sp.]|jgi:hypothetical protein|nr:hypothetical protein [Angelakisella sp.]
MRYKSSQVAVGGMASGLCLLLMFLTGMIPFSEYACPTFAGLVLIAVAEEMGRKTALIVYGAVSLLSLLLTPSKEAAILFVFFFGYYPVIRAVLMEKVAVRPVRLLLKLLLFNGMIVLSYLIVIHVLGIPDILEEFGSFGQYSALVLLLFGNIFFFVYDYTVGNLTEVYTDYFAPRFLRRGHR